MVSAAGTAVVVPSNSVLAHYSTNLVIANLVIAVILPNLVALVTARVSQNPLKAILLLALSAIGGVVSQIVAQGGDFHWKIALISFAQVFLTAVGTHFGLLKPTGITGSQGAIQTSVPGGIGSKGGVQPLGSGDNST